MSASLPVHPLVDLLPLLSEDDLGALIADIEAFGQREPATIWTDSADVTWLLDGRHRARAARHLGRTLTTTEFIGTEDEARSMVMSLNIHRRHLSPSARALAAAALATRQRGGVSGQQAGLPVPPRQADAARMAGVSERLVRDASAVMKFADDDIVRAVANGEMSVTAAAASVRERKTDRQAATALFLSHRRSSSSDSWLTPPWIIDRAIACLGGIDGDVAAAPEKNVPATWSLSERDDGLTAETWANPDGSPSRLWVNPPYNANGRGPQDWTRRVVEEWAGGTVESALLLLPARPGARWQQELARFPRLEFRGHLVFEPGVGNLARERWDQGTRSEAPFASIMVGVGVEPEQLYEHFGDVGVVLVAYKPDSSATR